MYYSYMECCGTKELNGVSDGEPPQKQIQNLLWRFQADGALTSRRNSAAHLIFTQAGLGSDYGLKLRDYIHENDLGDVIESRAATNPNTKRPIVVFVWTPKWSSLRKWLKKVERD